MCTQILPILRVGHPDSANPNRDFTGKNRKALFFLSLCIFPDHRVAPWGADAKGAFLPSVDIMEDSSIRWILIGLLSWSFLLWEDSSLYEVLLGNSLFVDFERTPLTFSFWLWWLIILWVPILCEGSSHVVSLWGTPPSDVPWEDSYSPYLDDSS